MSAAQIQGLIDEIFGVNGGVVADGQKLLEIGFGVRLEVNGFGKKIAFVSSDVAWQDLDVGFVGGKNKGDPLDVDVTQAH